MAQPTIKQMTARSLDGHHKILKAVAANTDVTGPMTSDSEIRGFRTCRETLIRWGCIEIKNLGLGQYETTLTDTGRELLAALNEKWSK